MNDESWAEQGHKAHQGIEPIRFLIGAWKGKGQSHGVAVTGTLVVTPILDGTWLQATETLTEVESEHTTVDLCFYRWHEKVESLQVFQFYEHAHLSTLLVEATNNGFRWVTGPLSPQLVFTKTDTGFEYKAGIEGQPEAVTQMSYVPA